MAVRNVLTFRPGSIGDCLMGKYFLEQVKSANPDATFTISVGTREGMVRDLFAAYPWIKVVNNRELGFARRDLVVTPYTGGVVPLKIKLFGRMIGKTLIGYSDPSPFNFLYNKIVPLVGRARAPRLLETDALQALNIPVAADDLTYTYVPQEGLLERLGLTDKGYLILHLFSGSDARGLSPARKRDLIEKLGILSIPIIVTGTAKETASLGKLPEGVRAVQSSIQELAHLIDHAKGMVSLDTGVAHIAAHMKKPLVVLASCVGEQWWSKDQYTLGTYTLFTRSDVCEGRHDYSGYAKCLEAIDFGAVVKAAQEKI